MDTREVDQQKTVPPDPSKRVARYTPDETPEEEGRAGPGRRIFFIVGAVVVVVLALVFGLPWLLYSVGHQGTDDARVDADLVAVTSRIPEKIQQILVDTNQPV